MASFSHIQAQEQAMEQQQRLTARQVAYMRMLEMPIEKLRTCIEEELIDNPALERVDEGDGLMEGAAEHADEGDGVMEAAVEPVDETEEFDADGHAERVGGEELMDQDAIDEMDYFESERPTGPSSYYNDDETAAFDDPDTPNFRDMLMQQVAEYTLTDHQRTLLEYLVGSLDDDGLLKKKLYVIADEMEIFGHVSTNTDELSEMLAILQQFDPPGIGAQSLQETLTLQIDNRIEQKPESTLWPLLRRVVTERWGELATNRWDRIKQRLKMNDGEVRALQRMLRTLTPSPGCPPSERQTSPHNENAIIPDFIVEVADDGTINIQLNEPGIPALRVSQSFVAAGLAEKDAAASLKGKDKARRREAMQYVQSRVTRANSFMLNVSSRRETLLRVMQEVAVRQRDFFVTGDESRLHFLMMKEVAAATGTDLSIISRVAGSKWVETPYGMRPLRWFFRGTGGVKTDDGTTLEQVRLKRAVADEIEGEDKRHPINDDEIARRLMARGLPIARRTVAKYRESLGIPVARMRKVR